MYRRLFLFCIIVLTCLQIKPASAQKDTSDYFAIGVLGGFYVGKAPINKNTIPNALGIEAEYYKYRDLSFYVSGVYEFTPSNKRIIYPYGMEPVHLKQKTFRVSVSFGGRYYLREKNVNPFFEAGLSHEINYLGGFHAKGIPHEDDDEFRIGPEPSYVHKLALNLGVGLSIKLDHKFKIEMKYDVYRSLTSSRDGFIAYSLLGGLKYNF